MVRFSTKDKAAVGFLGAETLSAAIAFASPVGSSGVGGVLSQDRVIVRSIHLKGHSSTIVEAGPAVASAPSTLTYTYFGVPTSSELKIDDLMWVVPLNGGALLKPETDTQGSGYMTLNVVDRREPEIQNRLCFGDKLTNTTTTSSNETTTLYTVPTGRTFVLERVVLWGDATLNQIKVAGGVPFSATAGLANILDLKNLRYKVDAGEAITLFQTGTIGEVTYGYVEGTLL